MKTNEVIDRIKAGDGNAWTELVTQFERRLAAFVESRIGRRAASSAKEDIVQETFLGFLNSLPSFDASRGIESWLFSICSHKLTDYLRREGRRPTVALDAGEDRDFLAGRDLSPAEIVSEAEQSRVESELLAEAVAEQIAKWTRKGDTIKYRCVKLLFVDCLGNKEVATELGITELRVSNYKADFIERTRTLVERRLAKSA